MPSPWPPPPRPGDRYATRRTIQPGMPPTIECRQVQLWGRAVWFHDPTGLVWCPTCLHLVDVADLARPDTIHAAIGLPRRTSAPMLLPMGDDPPGRRRRDGWTFDA